MGAMSTVSITLVFDDRSDPAVVLLAAIPLPGDRVYHAGLYQVVSRVFFCDGTVRLHLRRTDYWYDDASRGE